METHNSASRNSDLVFNFNKTVWEEEIGGVSSPYLRMTWNLVFEGFSRCEKFNQENSPAKKIVMPAQTGTGKTTSMCYFMQHLEEHTGALIVTSFITEADKIRDRINQGMDDIKAVSFHSDSEYKNKVDELKEYQVLIITHNMFINANDRKNNKVGDDRGKLDKFYQYKDGKRSLVVIDESVESIKATNLSYNDIHTLRTLLSSYGQHNCSNDNSAKDIERELKTLDRLLEFFSVAESIRDGRSKALIDTAELEKHLAGFDTSLTTTQELNDNGSLLKSLGKITKEKARNNISDMLQNTKIILDADWLYCTQDGYIRTARDAINNDTSCVILDATASVEYYYQIYPNIDFELANLIPVNWVRNYQNVTLFLSRGQNTGKSELTQNIGATVDRIREEIEKEVFYEGDIAVFTFKSVRDRLEDYAENSAINVKLGHFQNLTGKNDYKDCEKLFIFGTPYKPNYVTTNVHSLSKRGTDCFKKNDEVKDEYSKIKNTQMASELIQAINRTATRKVIDAKGNCPRTEVYITMPNDEKLYQTIVDSIKKQMPGVVLKNWDFKFSEGRKRGPVSEYDTGMVSVIKSLESEVAFSDVMDSLDATRKPQENIRNRLRVGGDNDILVQTMKECGVSFEQRSRKYWLVKH